MTPHGYQPENHAYLDRLTGIDDRGRRVGRDPGTIPLSIHPRSDAKSVIRRMQEASEASSGVAEKWCCSR